MSNARSRRGATATAISAVLPPSAMPSSTMVRPANRSMSMRYAAAKRAGFTRMNRSGVEPVS